MLNIILGAEAGSFIATVAKNATNFLQSLPPGVLLGVALIVMIHGFLKARLQPLNASDSPAVVKERFGFVGRLLSQVA